MKTQHFIFSGNIQVPGKKAIKPFYDLKIALSESYWQKLITVSFS